MLRRAPPQTPSHRERLVLGGISNCDIFGQMHLLQLNIYIDNPSGLGDFVNRLHR